MKRLSLPREHGAWLTLSGAILGGVWLAADRFTAGGLALSLAAAFLVRSQLEARRPSSWDAAARAFCALAILVGALVAGRNHSWIGMATACIALSAVTASGLAQRMRLHRSVWFEILSMAALGASAGMIAFAGRASLSASLAIGLVLGTHAAISVPLVRSDLRPRERAFEGRAMLLGMTLLSAATFLLWLLGIPAAAMALLPRAIDLTARHLTRFRLARAAAVGIRETIELAGAVTLLLAAILRR
jgi:hypothetical protein